MTERDIAQIKAKGIRMEQVENQIAYFRAGFPFLPIAAAAVVGDGIVRIESDRIEKMIGEYDRRASSLSILKFVPASGAATRMFKEMYGYVNEDKMCKDVEECLEKLDRFAFYKELRAILPDKCDEKQVISAIVEEGLGYGKLPKGLILFHSYPEGSRTAVEEHLAEGAMYARSEDGTVRIHFTVSPEHQKGFEELVERVLPKYEKAYDVKYKISYSQQKPKTDTIAVGMDNEPFREKDGSLLFRPGGHGALLDNLNELDADLIFVKNIDNVVPDRMKPDTVAYKKVLAALLLDLQQKCAAYLDAINQGIDEELVAAIVYFTEHELCYKFAPDFVERSVYEQGDILYDILNRPIRVCGMVKNEGEPGGGPFWVANADGSLSLQIAESSQISPEQKEMMQSATHFNPVDLVCCVRDYKGNKFDLTQYLDPQTGFISVKSKDGRELKAQELPGLWNGAMAFWNTVFAEVPVSTFNPVKSINDLLRSQHQ